MMAAREGRTDVVKELLSHERTNRDVRDRDGKTALDRAREKKHSDIVQLLEAR